ncbi:type I polyketide synthase [Sciscionella sediminilitoris]|uniref:type I polyketide synthase n=1 Tax=Sciscionella sediminilitoris TaxID=1445613 RepID=UPI0004DF09CD|nr:type I polyketide synthase [Sciscionella sp. SE31]
MNAERLRQWLITTLADICGIDDSDVDTAEPLRDFGLTSREAVGLAQDLGEELGRELSSELAWQYPTIEALVTSLTEEPSAEPEQAPAAARTEEPIAVVGLGCRLPGGIRGPEDFWRLLLAGESGVSEVPPGRWQQFGHDSPQQVERLSRLGRFGGFLRDIESFDAEFFGIAPREAAAMDPQQRMLLEVAWEAFEHAGISPERLRGTAAGVFVGISGNEYSHLTLDDLSRIDAWTGTGAALSIAANRLSYVLDLRGPSVAVDSACSSSLTAVHLAIQSLRSGESEIALAAGVNLILGPGVTVHFEELGVLSADGKCKTFDAEADGIARAEGAGVVVLKPLSVAQRDGDRVLAVLRGSALNSDGRSNGLTAPNPQAQQALLRAAYRNAGVAPSDVDYVEAHGTGTLLGDPIEANALGAVLGAERDPEHPLLLGSVKTNLGHLEAAAGITGLIKVVLAMANRRIPESLHFTEPNPRIDFEGLNLAVAAAPRPWPNHERPALAGVSGFGFGGTNAHVVVEQAPAAEQADPGDTGLYLLADATPDRLRHKASRLRAWLADEGSAVELGDIAHTMARRASGRHRGVIAAADHAELLSGLDALAGAVPDERVATGTRTEQGAVWVFSGQGSQWRGMGTELLRTEPAFADAVDEIAAALDPLTGWSFREVLENGVEPEEFAELQPYLFGVQLALAMLWRSYGAEPAAVVGHSLGEIAAAVIAGAVSLADGALIVVHRSRLLARTAGLGTMAVLELSVEEVRELLFGYADVDIAAHNAPGQTVVAGQFEQVRAIADSVAARGLLGRLVNTEVAGHCRIVAPCARELTGYVSEVDGVLPGVPMYLSASEDPRAQRPLDGDYWVDNVRNPVRFAEAVSAALEDGHRTFLEISPHPVLRHAVHEIAEGAGVRPLVLGTLRRDEGERERFAANRAGLLAVGAIRYATHGRLVDIPTTAWQGGAHWTKPATRVPAEEHPLLGTYSEVPGGELHVWSADLGLGARPWLGEHRLGGRPVLAASCVVEMALRAGQVALGLEPGRLEVRGLRLLETLPLGERTRVTTTVENGRFRLHTKENEGTWTLLAEAELAETEPLQAELGEPAGEPVPPARFYERLRALSVDHGPAFTGITELRTGEHGAHIRVELPESAPRGGFGVHPVLLDGCLQAITAAFADPEAVWLPVELGAIRGNPGEAVRAEVSVRGEGAEPYATVRLADAQDRVVLELEHIALRRRTRAELAAPLRERLLGRTWRPIPPAPSDAGDPLVLLDESSELTGLESARRVAYVLGAGSDHGQAGLARVLDLVRALAENPHARLWLVTRNAAAVLPGEQGDPALAAVRGLVRVLANEQPRLRVSWLDVDDLAVIDAATRDGGDPEDEVAVRGADRYGARIEPVPAPVAQHPLVRADGGYVITGGLSGLGLLVAGWLAERGAGRIVLNARSAPNDSASAAIEELRAHGTEVAVVRGDIAEPGVAERLLAEAGNPRGVVHAAAVFDDRTAALLDAETLERTWAPKAIGAMRLHEASKELELDWWFGFSSAAALLGSPGQPGYACANAYLDALVALRRAEGLPAASVQWGTWAQVGAAADLEMPGVRAITPEEGIEVFERTLGQAGTFGAVPLDIPELLAAFPGIAGIPLFAELCAGHEVETGRPDIAEIRDTDPEQARELVTGQVLLRVAEVTGHAAESFPAEVPLPSLGVDSLLAVRIRNALEHDFGVAPTVSVLLRGSSAAQLRDWMCAELGLGPADAAAAAEPELTGPRDAAERLVVAVWEEVLGEPVGVRTEFPDDPVRAELVAALLSERSGHPQPVAELFANRTPELQAMLVRAAQRADAGPVRVLRAEGEGAPLFLFHPGGGDTAVFRQLVDLLGTGYPVYGFDRTETTASVEERVRDWLPELRRRQPHGPYRLGGWSFGGFLAYECAQQLRAEGERVDVLAMIDPIVPLPEPDGVSEVELLERRFERYGEFLRTAYGKDVELPYAEMARRDAVGQADLLVQSIVDAKVIDERVGKAILAHQHASFLDARLLERYQPQPYPGPVQFYSAGSAVPGGLRDARFDRSDPARGWDEFCSRLELRVVPGHHLSLLDPPNVEVIAEHLNRVLRAARVLS